MTVIIFFVIIDIVKTDENIKIMGVRMVDFLIWLIEQFGLFHGFEKGQILRSFDLAFLIIFVFIFIVSIICLINFFSKPYRFEGMSAIEAAFYSFIGALVISGLASMFLHHSYNPKDPESLIKTTQIKNEQTVIIPSEGVTDATLKLKDSDVEFQPSTLKEGDILTLTVTVGDKEFKKEFPYKKENLKIKKGKTDKVTSGVLLTRSFKDELFNHERIREEEDVVLELETSDPFSNASN